MSKKFFILCFAVIGFIGLVVVFNQTGLVGQAIAAANSNNAWILPMAVIAAMIDSINPCAFSVLFLTIGFLFSLGRPRNEILKIGGVYIAGIYVVYILIGFLGLRLLQYVGGQHIAAKIGAAILIASGVLEIVNEFFPKFPIKLQIPQISKPTIARLLAKATVPAMALLGVAVGLFEFPCTGQAYVMIITLLHSRETFVNGVLYLILYNLVFVLPLILILFIASDQGLLAKAESWKKRNVENMRLYGGLIMIFLGIIIFML